MKYTKLLTALLVTASLQVFGSHYLEPENAQRMQRLLSAFSEDINDEKQLAVAMMEFDKFDKAVGDPFAAVEYFIKLRLVIDPNSENEVKAVRHKLVIAKQAVQLIKSGTSFSELMAFVEKK